MEVRTAFRRPFIHHIILAIVIIRMLPIMPIMTATIIIMTITEAAGLARVKQTIEQRETELRFVFEARGGFWRSRVVSFLLHAYAAGT